MKKLIISLLSVLGICVVSPFTSQAADAVKHVNADSAAKLIQEHKDLVILDVRRDAEFEDGHIAKAKNLDFYGKDFADKLKALDKEKPYLVHCASGGRSTKSLETFKQLGFKQVYHLDGGFNGWKDAKQPVEK